MTGLIITSVVLWFATLFVQGINISTILSLASTVLFCARKFNYFAKLSSLLTMEVLGLFILTMWRLLFQSFSIFQLLVVVVLRFIFIAIVYYDTEYFSYVTEEHRVDKEDDD